MHANHPSVACMPCQPLLSPQTMATKRILLPSSLAAVAFTIFTLLPIAVTAHFAPLPPKPPMPPSMGDNINQPNPNPNPHPNTNANGKPTLMPPKQGNNGAFPFPQKPPMPPSMGNNVNQPNPNGNANAKPTSMTETATTEEMDQQAINEYLSTHNKARAAVGLKPLTWNATLAKIAKQWATTRMVDCTLTHSSSEEYGENLYWANMPNWTPARAVKLWVDEMFDYDPQLNKCADKKMCGHYTQVVWKDTTSVGCAKVSCQNKKGLFVACNYYPPGNYIDEHPFGPNKADVDECIKKFLASKVGNKSTPPPSPPTA